MFEQLIERDFPELGLAYALKGLLEAGREMLPLRDPGDQEEVQLERVVIPGINEGKEFAAPTPNHAGSLIVPINFGLQCRNPSIPNSSRDRENSSFFFSSTSCGDPKSERQDTSASGD